jgi:hypothetical protein
MEYLEALEEVEEMRARFDSGFSLLDKNRIEVLYMEVLNKRFVKTNCGSCYKDAYVEIYVWLKREKKMKEKSNYGLLNGVIIQDIENNKIFTNENINDEVAEEYLRKYPQRIDLFAKFPEDWENRIKKEPIKEGPIEGDKVKADEVIDEGDKADESSKGTANKVDPDISEEEDKERENLVEEIADRLKSGSTIKQVTDDYRDYMFDGKKMSDEDLKSIIGEAEELVNIENKK